MPKLRLQLCADVDGCILNISAPFTSWWNQRYEPKLNSNPHTWYYGLPEEDSKRIMSAFTDFFKETDIVANLPYYSDDTIEYFNKISKFINIHIVTAFPGALQQLRIDNLKDLNYRDIVFKYTKEHYIINELKPDIIIEDKPSLIKQLFKNKFIIFFPDWNYTKDLNGFGTVYHNWKELHDKLVVL